MAGWLTAFKVIPWADVIAAAPTVVRGAKKLWDTARKPSPDAAGAAAPGSPEARVELLERQGADLRRELAATSELLNSLAEQNARLVEAVGILRVRTRALLVVCAAAYVLLFALGVWVLVA